VFESFCVFVRSEGNPTVCENKKTEKEKGGNERSTNPNTQMDMMSKVRSYWNPTRGGME